MRKPCCCADWVSIHAPARGATLPIKGSPKHKQFQSTRPRGARLADHHQHSDANDVSIHAPARGATRSLPTISAPGGFNPRARAGRDPDAFSVSPCNKFQSTRPRGARRSREVDRVVVCHVSIHAPARGATSVTVDYKKDTPVSIHAPARGATNR